MTVQDFVVKTSEFDAMARPHLRLGDQWRIGPEGLQLTEDLLTFYSHLSEGMAAPDLRLIVHEDGTFSLIDAACGLVGSGDTVGEATFELVFGALQALGEVA